jgi:hypothetical protein
MITQDSRSIVFFRRKLSVMQQKYSATKIELLAIVETLQECKGMMWRHFMKVFTDHKNLTRDDPQLDFQHSILMEVTVRRICPQYNI